jgi:hypothetical protein
MSEIEKESEDNLRNELRRQRRNEKCSPEYFLPK